MGFCEINNLENYVYYIVLLLISIDRLPPTRQFFLMHVEEIH